MLDWYHPLEDSHISGLTITIYFSRHKPSVNSHKICPIPKTYQGKLRELTVHTVDEDDRQNHSALKSTHRYMLSYHEEHFVIDSTSP